METTVQDQFWNCQALGRLRQLTHSGNGPNPKSYVEENLQHLIWTRIAPSEVHSVSTM